MGNATAIALLLAWSGSVPPGRLSPTPSWVIDQPEDPSIAMIGFQVAGLGDVNGDGLDDVAVGAPGSTLGCCQPGEISAFHGTLAGPAATPDWWVVPTGEWPPVEEGYGAGVGGAGDVNGDGFRDLIYSASFQVNTVQVHHGAPTGFSPAASWSVGTGVSGTYWPSPATGAGDVNGDGFDDVIVGVSAYGGGVGRALVFHGSAAGLSTTPAQVLVGDAANQQLGHSVASAGDVNGDGYDDVLVASATQAHLHLGSAAGVASASAWTAAMQPHFSSLGTGFRVSTGEVAGAGDVDGDGYDDVLVGSPAFSNGETFEGRVQLFRGSATGLVPTPAWSLESNRAGTFFGSSIAGAGDVDADGSPDVIVGEDPYGRGRASVFLGGPAGPASSPAWTVAGPTELAQFGRCVRGAGDVNGDGRDDVLVGSPAQTDVFSQGAAYLFLGVPAAGTGPAASVPDGASGPPLTLWKERDGSLGLAWGVSCAANEMDWEIYAGTLGDFTTHAPVLCTTGGQRGARVTPPTADAYYLVVPRTLDFEGSYGERPAAVGACLPQSILACP